MPSDPDQVAATCTACGGTYEVSRNAEVSVFRSADMPPPAHLAVYVDGTKVHECHKGQSGSVDG